MFFRCRAFFVYNFFAVCYNFLLRHVNFIIENEEELQMEKKKKFQMPHTYIIIFGVILFAAILTMFIPLGKYETKEITYTMNGEEKTRTVLAHAGATPRSDSSRPNSCASEKASTTCASRSWCTTQW